MSKFNSLCRSYAENPQKGVVVKINLSFVNEFSNEHDEERQDLFRRKYKQ